MGVLRGAPRIPRARPSAVSDAGRRAASGAAGWRGGLACCGGPPAPDGLRERSGAAWARDGDGAGRAGLPLGAGPRSSAAPVYWFASTTPFRRRFGAVGAVGAGREVTPRRDPAPRVCSPKGASAIRQLCSLCAALLKIGKEPCAASRPRTREPCACTLRRWRRRAWGWPGCRGPAHRHRETRAPVRVVPGGLCASHPSALVLLCSAEDMGMEQPSFPPQRGGRGRCEPGGSARWGGERSSPRHSGPFGDRVFRSWCLAQGCASGVVPGSSWPAPSRPLLR